MYIMLNILNYKKLTMSLDIGDVVIGLLTILVTVIGYIITYKCLKKGYKLDSISKRRLNAATEMKESLEYTYKFFGSYIEDTFTLNKDPASLNETDFNNLRKKLTSLIIKYGFLDSIKLWSYIEYNFVSINNKIGEAFFTAWE